MTLPFSAANSDCLIIACTVLLVLLLSGLYIFYNTRSLRLTRYQITLASLPRELDGLTILQLSDLHSKHFGHEQSRLFKLLNSLSFDIIALTGDMISKMHPDYGRLEEFLQQLKNPQNRSSDKPIFFVYGNHELWIDRTTTGQIQKQGIKILNNESFYYQPDNNKSGAESSAPGIWIIGVDDPHQGHPDLQAALNSIPVDNTSAKILLAHAPAILNEAVAQKIDLILAGHTHGGQICLPLIGALYAPGQSFFPEYVYGLYQLAGTQMIINGGLGESNLPFRLFNRPEVVLVQLHSKTTVAADKK